MSNRDIEAEASFFRNKAYLLNSLKAHPDSINLVFIDCLMLLKMLIDQIDDPELREEMYGLGIQSIEEFRK